MATHTPTRDSQTSSASAWRPPAPTQPRLHAAAQRIGGLSALDGAARRIGRTVRSALPPGGVRDALSGRALGHALHPLLTDLPLGFWTSATVLDLVGGDEGRHAARRLTALGIASALPTAASGWVDWADTEPADDEVRRVGIVHAASNVTALLLYAGSLARPRGRLLRLAGAGALAVGGHLGGHLSYSKGVGVDANALGPTLADWTNAGDVAELREGEPVCRRVGAVDVLLVRDRGQVCALANRCSHRGGALHEGAVEDGTVTCPLHGSRFRLADGNVERGPAAYPQPTFEVRETNGRLELRAAHGEPTL